jgi:hypothetical protein
MGRTPVSVFVICETQATPPRLYYKGYGLGNQLPVEIDDPTPTGSGFTATNNGVQYAISRDALVITKGSNVISNEPTLEYWSA